MGHVQELLAPLRWRLAVCFAVFPSLRPTNDCTHRNDENIDQFVARIGTPGIASGSKMVWKRSGRKHPHRATSLWQKGSV
jgi:hypothetical protein